MTPVKTAEPAKTTVGAPKKQVKVVLRRLERLETTQYCRDITYCG